jgi:hypothetical protein
MDRTNEPALICASTLKKLDIEPDVNMILRQKESIAGWQA